MTVVNQWYDSKRKFFFDSIGIVLVQKLKLYQAKKYIFGLILVQKKSVAAGARERFGLVFV